MTKVAALPLNLKPAKAKKRVSKRRQQLLLLRELQRDAKAGDRGVWGRLGDGKNVGCKELKAELRRYLKARQEPRCCYCKRWLLNNAHASPIEHVLPRKTYPQFALRMRNLMIACVDCNGLKTNDDWGLFPGPHDAYPQPQLMLFFHPRYHSYDEHVRYVRVETNQQEFVTYHGLTPEGRHLCAELLSKVVGKQNLRRSYPQLEGWLRVMAEHDADPQSAARPALEAFRETMDKAIVERLNDGAKSTALWDIP